MIYSVNSIILFTFLNNFPFIFFLFHRRNFFFAISHGRIKFFGNIFLDLLNKFIFNWRLIIRLFPISNFCTFSLNLFDLYIHLRSPSFIICTSLHIIKFKFSPISQFSKRLLTVVLLNFLIFILFWRICSKIIFSLYLIILLSIFYTRFLVNIWFILAFIIKILVNYFKRPIINRKLMILSVI